MTSTRAGAGIWARLFWIAGGIDVLLLAWAAVTVASGPTSRYDFLIYGLLLLAFLAVAAVLGFVALLRRPWAYGLGTVLLVAPPLAVALPLVSTFVATPGAPALGAGRGYFSAPADRALAEAIVTGDAAQVSALAASANLGAVGWNGMTFLRLALEKGRARPDVVRALLRAGVNPEQDNQMLFGSLVDVEADYGMMIKDRDAPLLRAVIESGIDLNARDLSGRPRFFSTLRWPDGLAMMLAGGADPQAPDSDGRTALMWAVLLREWDAIDLLLAHGARIDAVARDGQSVKDIVIEMRGRLEGPLPPPLARLEDRLR